MRNAPRRAAGEKQTNERKSRTTTTTKSAIKTAMEFPHFPSPPAGRRVVEHGHELRARPAKRTASSSRAASKTISTLLFPCSVVAVEGVGVDVHVEFGARDAAVEVEDVVARRAEVRGRVVRRGDEAPIDRAVVRRLERVVDRVEALDELP